MLSCLWKLKLDIYNLYMCLTMGMKNCTEEWVLPERVWRVGWLLCKIKYDSQNVLYCKSVCMSCCPFGLFVSLKDGEVLSALSLWCHSLGFKCRYVCICVYYSHIFDNAVYTQAIPPPPSSPQFLPAINQIGAPERAFS